MSPYVIRSITRNDLRCDVPCRAFSPTEACYYAWRKWVSDGSILHGEYVGDEHRSRFEEHEFRVSLESTRVVLPVSDLRYWFSANSKAREQ